MIKVFSATILTFFSLVFCAGAVLAADPSPSPTPIVTQNGSININNSNSNTNTQNQTNNQTVTVGVSRVAVPRKQPETGVGMLGMATMFGAIPVGLALRRYGRKTILKGKKAIL